MIDNHPHRKEKILEIITHSASEFIQKESNQNSMITVTRAELSSDFQKADIFVTVFPDDKEEKAIEFLKRNLNEFRDFVKSKTRLQHIPWFDFKIDQGEKKRQRIDELSLKI
ncbi:MAG TPA: ribosome-binding factor A [Candidatus Paceibacterota bacterium]|nr:ribosome-binding factor A [Candidatus Paceibacterota bacterium]HMP18817.1 ribosome-binding factor A [Candidatus Paceibacterota bacterium]HMP85415.1 ribosome-binding factor A [Candidatus Paceibacterota bacterium]